MVFRLQWVKAAVSAGRVSQWVSSGRRAPSSMQEGTRRHRTVDQVAFRWTDFPSKQEEGGERSLWLSKSFTLNLSWKKNQHQANCLWTSDTLKKKILSCLHDLDDDVINCAHASWLPQEKTGGGWMWPSGCSIYCSTQPSRKCVWKWIYVLCGCPHFLMSLPLPIFLVPKVWWLQKVFR